ncbi:HAMP domain-containing histidine kinase (plasmid) [Salinirubellus salinus]|uniref:histidine kinase n=2 Tax=Salinirubellus salinus TaxID=1364945 RepID=A0A9E7R804_9EURY|nr:HAMP domain-containing sensor histidine kinase [Salinirubellus salinus]UWM57101.1 HAMP domain-containing histidine kinase [Salinirubellus salinus]
MPDVTIIRVTDETLEARIREFIRDTPEAVTIETISVVDDPFSEPEDDGTGGLVLSANGSGISLGGDADEPSQQSEQSQTFDADIAHDLRGPLSVAGGYIELARETGDLSHLHSATEALNRANQLLAHIQELSREGRMVADPEPADIAVLARAAWRAVPTGDVTLEVTSTRTLMADKTRLQELFENLFCNVVEHAGSGITVRVGSTDGGFYVEDDGVGISESEREAVFETGYSGGVGTGQGLAIVERIAEAHGWRVELLEATDGGARFEFANVEMA